MRMDQLSSKGQVSYKRLFLQMIWIMRMGLFAAEGAVSYNRLFLQMLWIVRIVQLLAKGMIICNIFLQIIHKSQLLARRTVHLEQYFFAPNQQEYYLVLTEKLAAKWGAGGSK